jgi:hypothetical protein
MSPPAPAFGDRIAVIAAELADLGKRPVSVATFNEIVLLHERLATVLGEFVVCDRCGNLFPNIAQLTLDGRSANMCTSCAITALQRGTIDTPPIDRGAVAPIKLNPTSARVEQIVATAPRAEQIPPATPPSPVMPSATLVGDPVLPPPEPEEEESDIEDEDPDETDEVGDEEIIGENEEDEQIGASASPGRRPAGIPRLVARRATDEAAQLKATHGDVAKHLGRPTREVRQIARLIEEISPPLDVPKTTHYVLAELRNARSKIPLDTVYKAVKLLKDGIPPGGNGNNGGGG